MTVGFGGGIMGTGYGSMFVTTNAGATVLPTSVSPAAWSSIATSVDGNQLVAVVGGPSWSPTITGPIYTSADSGTNWTLTDAPTNECWTSAASSADGRKLVAVSGVVITSGTSPRLGSIYISKTTPSPVLNINVSSENLVVSWTVPSLNFSLSQATDPTKAAAWAPVAVASTINYSNLQYQVTIPKPQGTMFYRLVSQ
jgi:hypothetical protein